MGMTIVSLSIIIWMGESDIVARMEQVLFNASPEDSTTSWISNNRKATNNDKSTSGGGGRHAKWS